MAPRSAESLGSGTPGAPPLSNQDFALFQRMVYREAGIYLPPSKHFLLSRRLGARIRELGLRSFAAYYRRVSQEGDPRERTLMLELITTNETRFFREPRQFELLEKRLVPEWKRAAAERRRPRHIRGWSAGCSTGQEVYSLAMVLAHHLPPEEGWQIELLASDLSVRALEKARDGVWPLESTKEIPRRYLKRFMLKGIGSQSGLLAAGPKLRGLVRLQRVNLNDTSWPVAGPFDLIFCRNVLIYFDAASKGRVIHQCLDTLKRDGHLFLGHAESLRGVTDRVRCVIPTVFELCESGAVE